MIEEKEIGLLLTALLFSADKHRNQRRKDAAKSPYINHPIEVAELLWSVGGFRELSILIAATLHDTIEDTATLPEEIQDHFGAEVLHLVLEVTDDKSLPKLDRKRLQIEAAPHKTYRAKCIKLADFICNLQDIIQSPPADWSVERIQDYLLWTEKVVAGLRGTNPALENRYDFELARGKKKYSINL
jgi:GTP diphosphokinase / guanosine-3',5'-bis(diphosphate) 3'-diphosphatase